MLININEIKVNPGRRGAAPEDVQRLSESVAEVGMMNPDHRHRRSHLDCRFAPPGGGKTVGLDGD